MSMSRCLIIPSLDGGPLDKRYGDIIVPAVRNAGMEAYRIEARSGAIPSEELETEMGDADVVILDVSSQHPSIWYQLGYAMASNVQVLLLCSQEAWTQFPIDAWSQPVVLYSADSPATLEALKMKIANRLKTLQANELYEPASSGGRTVSNALSVESISEHELVCLLCVAQCITSPRDYVFFQKIKQDMLQYGYAPIAITLALTSLLRKNMLMMDEVGDDFGNTESIYYVTSNGLIWLQENQGRFVLRELTFMQRFLMKFGKRQSPVQDVNYAFNQS